MSEELLKEISHKSRMVKKKPIIARDLILRCATNRNFIIVVRNKDGYKGSDAFVRNSIRASLTSEVTLGG